MLESICWPPNTAKAHARLDVFIDYVTGIGNMMTSPVDSSTFHGGTTGTIRVTWLCGPLLEFEYALYM